MIGGFQANVERRKVGLDRPEPGATWSARFTTPVCLKRGQAGLNSSSPCTCSVTKELETAAADNCQNDVSELHTLVKRSQLDACRDSYM